MLLRDRRDAACLAEKLRIWVPVSLQPKHQTSHLKIFKYYQFRHLMVALRRLPPHGTPFWWYLGAHNGCIDFMTFLYH